MGEGTRGHLLLIAAGRGDRATWFGSRLSRHHGGNVNAVEIQLIQRTLRRHGGLEMAVVFGSVAQGKAHADSDLDIAVQAARPLSSQQMMALISDLAEATGRPVDLIDLRTVGEPLLGQILGHGCRLLDSEEAHGSLLSRHLIDAADFLSFAQRIVDERRRAWIGK